MPLPYLNIFTLPLLSNLTSQVTRQASYPITVSRICVTVSISFKVTYHHNHPAPEEIISFSLNGSGQWTSVPYTDPVCFICSTPQEM
jgi:hypothetical protein